MFDRKRLRERRKEMNMTLDDLAKASGSVKSYIWELEKRDDLSPGGEKVFLIAKALAVPMEYFYGGDLHVNDYEARIGAAVLRTIKEESVNHE